MRIEVDPVALALGKNIGTVVDRTASEGGGLTTAQLGEALCAVIAAYALDTPEPHRWIARIGLASLEFFEQHRAAAAKEASQETLH